MPNPEIDSLDADAWFRRLMSGVRKAKPSELRYWTVKLWKFRWYLWLRGVMARVRARLAPVPLPEPRSAYHSDMGFRMCFWENDGGYVTTNIMIPGTDIELLLHMQCNRVVGLKIWNGSP